MKRLLCTIVPFVAATLFTGCTNYQKEEGRTEFTVYLKEVPADRKIRVIKEVRAITGLGLADAKDMVEAAPKAVLVGVKKEDAERFKEQLDATGATVELH